MDKIELKSNRLKLRLVKENDLNSIHELHSLPETDEFNTLGIPKNISETKSILESWIKNLKSNSNYIFAIELIDSNKFIGLIALNLGREKLQMAEVWYKIHNSYWNKGYATECLNCVLNFGFENLNLHRIIAGCAVENSGSIRVLEKVGMMREGRGRQILPLKSGWSDNYEYAILKSDREEKSINFDVIAKDQAHVWHPFTQHETSGVPLEIVKADGVYLYDSNGKSYIDANSSWWVNTHGHGHPHIGKAISEQFNTIDHIVFAGVTHKKAAELAERIVDVLPDHFQKVFFSDNGSTAVEIALKMVIQYWHNKGEKKQRFLAMHGSYHGDTFGAMSVRQRGYFNEPFEPFFFEVDYIDFPSRDKEKGILERAEKLFSTEEFAGMILEPLVQGAAGMKMYSSDFLDELTALAHKYNVLVIFDEVMTGFGRTGKLFSMDHCKNKPDLVSLSKGLTAGVMALGLTVASDEIYDAFLSENTTKALLHGHSFTANPIACAVACANLDLFEKEQTWKNIDSICNWNRDFAEELKSFDCVVDVRQKGTILAFEVSTGEGNTYFSDIKTKAYEFFLENGILLRPLGNIIFVNAPYCISEMEYKKVTSTISKFLTSL